MIVNLFEVGAYLVVLERCNKKARNPPTGQSLIRT
jgi:hypothetical protein